jgi:hypothetical protein
MQQHDLFSSPADVNFCDTDSDSDAGADVPHLEFFDDDLGDQVRAHVGALKRQKSAPVKQQRKFKFRNRILAQEILYADYFATNSVYDDNDFARRFRMGKQRFLKIVTDLERNDTYFQQKCDAANRPGFTSLQKVASAMKQLAYGVTSDAFDEYLKMGQNTQLECLRKFCDALVSVYGAEYLRKPTVEDLEQLLEEGERLGFPGMLGSVDCMHWTWKNCPTAWHGQFQGRSKKPTVILEAVASDDMWIWHHFFGLPGSVNDINVLDRSPLFKDVMNCTAPLVKYSINGQEYNAGYYLADGIYPPYATFVKTIPIPQTEKQKVCVCA